MKILFITPRFPYPPLKGDQVRSYNQIRILSQRHSITLLSFIENSEELNYVPMLRRLCSHIETVELGSLRSYLNVLWGIFSPLPLQIHYYYSPEMENRIRAVIENDGFDVVHVQLIRMAPYRAHFDEMPTVMDFIDALSLNMERRYRCDKGVLRLGAYIEWRRIKNYEREVCKQFDGVIVVSPVDKEAMGSFANISVNPLGVDTETFTFVSGWREPYSIIFTGNMGYFPNIEAMHYFVREAFPLIRLRIPEVRLYIVGANPPRNIRKLSADENIMVTGFVDSIHEYLARTAVAVCPVRAGSGMQFKILEAMSTGVPVVATEYALKAIQATPGENIIVANEPAEFAHRVVELLKNPSLRQRLATNARQLIEKKYTWEISVRQLERIYEAAITAHALKRGNMQADRETKLNR
jgi:sugar transferase (PEP-CTERM/EpsH1 system associated)